MNAPKVDEKKIWADIANDIEGIGFEWSEIADRFAEAREKAGVTQAKAGKGIGGGAAMVSRIESGAALPRARDVVELARVYGTNETYLTLGDDAKTLSTSWEIDFDVERATLCAERRVAEGKPANFRSPPGAPPRGRKPSPKKSPAVSPVPSPVVITATISVTRAALASEPSLTNADLEKIVGEMLDSEIKRSQRGVKTVDDAYLSVLIDEIMGMRQQ